MSTPNGNKSKCRVMSTPGEAVAESPGAASFSILTWCHQVYYKCNLVTHTGTKYIIRGTHMYHTHYFGITTTCVIDFQLIDVLAITHNLTFHYPQLSARTFKSSVYSRLPTILDFLFSILPIFFRMQMMCLRDDIRIVCVLATTHNPRFSFF